MEVKVLLYYYYYYYYYYYFCCQWNGLITNLWTFYFNLFIPKIILGYVRSIIRNINIKNFGWIHWVSIVFIIIFVVEWIDYELYEFFIPKIILGYVRSIIRNINIKHFEYNKYTDYQFTYYSKLITENFTL